MSLPPERITVKRRRDEDPIEALFVQQKRHRPGAVWKLAGGESDKPVNAQPEIPLSPLEGSQLLTLRPLEVPLPSENASKAPQGIFKNPVEVLPSRENPFQPTSTRVVRQGHGSRGSTASEPRTFYLTKSLVKVSSPYLVCKPNKQRRFQNSRNELAVFVEAGKASSSRAISRKQVLKEEALAELVRNSQEDIKTTQTPRRRPNATAAEQKWRAENWDKSIKPRTPTKQRIKLARQIDQPSHEWDYQSPELAAQLQHIALQETEAHEAHLNHKNDSRPLKTKPKPPKPRRTSMDKSITHRKVQDGDDIMTESTPLDDDADYVFDTYIRSVAQPQDTIEASDPLIGSLQGVDRSNMGMLVIGDGEEELWETFGEDVDSGPGWDSEDEDENAEDFYGNDYPEDEVNSDDEFGRGAYNYRRYASDDEEYDNDEPNWSGSDEISHY